MIVFSSQERQIAHFYKIYDSYIAGLKLKGWQVKSIKLGGASLVGSTVMFDSGLPVLFGVTINPSKCISKSLAVNSEKRVELLLNKNEISKINGQISRAGLVLIPLDLHMEHNLVKVKLGLCKKLPKYDLRKRDKEREKDVVVSLDAE